MRTAQRMSNSAMGNATTASMTGRFVNTNQYGRQSMPKTRISMAARTQRTAPERSARSGTCNGTGVEEGKFDMVTRAADPARKGGGASLAPLGDKTNSPGEVIVSFPAL